MVQTIDQALSSVQNMQKFFDESQDIDQIKKLSIKQNDLSTSCLYYDRWHVCLIIIKGPLVIFGAVFLECTKGICNAVGAKSLSYRCIVITAHLEYEIIKLSTFCNYGKKLLVPSTNDHQIRTSDFYLHRPIALASLDPALQKLSEADLIRFNHLRGVCRGMGLWFLYLYFTTRNSFTDPVAHMRAIGMQFKKGAQRQAAMIQSFVCLEKQILNMNIQEDFALIPALNFTEKPAMVKQSLENLPSAAYTIWIHRHHIDYLKFNNHTAFIFDSNFGVIDISGADQPQQLYEFLKRYHDRKYDPKDDLFDRVYFHLVTGIEGSS